MFFVLVVIERESSKGVDALLPPEFWDGEVDRGYAKRFAIKIEILARHTKVLLLRPVLLLFRRIVYGVSRLFGTETPRIDQGVRLKQQWEQIIRDLAMVQGREEVLAC